jgi:hypothetical protein
VPCLCFTAVSSILRLRERMIVLRKGTGSGPENSFSLEWLRPVFQVFLPSKNAAFKALVAALSP